jgi:4,5-dihydroxyphthalate decarboxylase
VLRLLTAIGSYPHTLGLKSSAILNDRVELEHVEITPISNAFKPMCRDLAFDVAEMSITGYLLGRVYEKGFTALPVFPVRAFGSAHSATSYDPAHGPLSPHDLEGKAVGARAYTGAASFWARAVLMHEFGLDTGSITWVSTDEEHVLEYQRDAPRNAVYDLGADLHEMLRSGRIAAGIGLGSAGGDLRPLIPDARVAAIEYYKRTGIYQINHVIVVKDELITEHPWLVSALYDAFVEAKRDWLAGGPALSSTADIGLPDGDPFPYGIEKNRVTLESLAQFAGEQKILPRNYSVAELFPLQMD